MAGQVYHFRQCAQEKIPYAIDRYTSEFLHLKRRFERIRTRPAVKRSFALGRDLDRALLGCKAKEAEKAYPILFGQRARK